MVINQVSFDVSKSNYIMVYARKGEINARSIVATFQDAEEETLDLTDKSVTFYALKPDGTKIYNNCTVDAENGTATINLTSQMVSVSGIVNCEYQIFSGNTLLLKVNGLKIVVEDGGDFAEAVESSSEYNTLISAINTAQGFSESVGSVSNLTTTEKGTVVGAINELNSKTIPISRGGTGATTRMQARINLGVMTGTVLYDNISGTKNTISLSYSYTLYDLIYVQFVDNGVTNSTVFGTVAGNQISLINWYAWYDSNNSIKGLYYHGALLTFTGSQAAFTRSLTYQVVLGNTGDLYSADGGVKVTKIIGYNY